MVFLLFAWFSMSISQMSAVLWIQDSDTVSMIFFSPVCRMVLGLLFHNILKARKLILCSWVLSCLAPHRIELNCFTFHNTIAYYSCYIGFWYTTCESQYLMFQPMCEKMNEKNKIARTLLLSNAGSNRSALQRGQDTHTQQKDRYKV